MPSFAARAVSAAALTVGLVLAGAAAPDTAHAGTRKVSFLFKYRLEGKTWKQKAGKTVFTITGCNIPGIFHVELVRSRWGRDTRMSGKTMKCERGQRAVLHAPVDGTYYLLFTKLDDDRFYKGTATIAYPG
ncbi:hypothetical protein [Thermostaphylospora chromogena]|uniref:Uncharacterized protein n=1 Tax=Thermostaphylospora chromogena TaxID=35622 RepID=A0A1H1GNW5_9ACTN|nr:hypothetical protein [Thermostaphylospora chromogena]SDR14867.1 hypothetical protein SAMN04489764_3714 [Thermostaphylospora chromogena]